MNALADITEETVCLKEIKDILDELNSVLYIFGQQIAVVESMVDEVSLLKQVQERNRQFTKTSSTAEDSGQGGMRKQSENRQIKDENGTTAARGSNPSGNGDNPALGHAKNISDDKPNNSIDGSSEDLELKYRRVLKTLRRRNKDIENLKTNAYTVYKDVRCNYNPLVHPKTNIEKLCDLLDLKQKQASVTEAISARQEAKETARQGQTILLFTVITIIFVST